MPEIAWESEESHAGVLLQSAGRVRQIVLNEPERRNPMSPGIMAGLVQACDRLEHDVDAHVVLITGAGTVFSAGGDLDYNGPPLRRSLAERRDFLEALYRPFLRVLDLPMPTVAVLNGAAVGGGLAFALLADLRVASDDAALVSAFAAMGFTPGLAFAYSLERLVGPAVTAELVYTGRAITGREAADLGLVNRSVPSSDVASEAWNMAQQIAAQKPNVARSVKSAMAVRYRAELRVRLERDILAQVISSESDEYLETLAESRGR